MHKPIFLNNLSLDFPHKICFENFTTSIQHGQHIAIIGRNGSGKSSLLKIIKEYSSQLNIGYIPQIIENFGNLSGGQRFNKSLTESLKKLPDVLLLDEPTNHLDHKNRRSLMRMLKNYTGTLIVVSHDVELLNGLVDIFWHIDNGKINIFTGNYNDYIYETKQKRASIENELRKLESQKKDMHQNLMQEQQRASKSKNKGKKSIDSKKWPTVTAKCKALRAQETTGKKKLSIENKKQDLSKQLSDLRLPEIIKPKFSIRAEDIGNHVVVSVENASCGYIYPILKEINFSLRAKEKISIKGDNASGKSTLIKAILNDSNIQKEGNWNSVLDIGYLDQYYSVLNPKISVLETISSLNIYKDMSEIRCHLNDFLFRKNEEVNLLISELSGGEKARLCLAIIAAKTPKLLILDEVTNNIDLETRQHIIQVLKNYPGAIIVISHDEDFLKEIDIIDSYKINDGKIIIN